MPISLSERDRRLIRFTVIGVGIYLLLFFGFKGWRSAEKSLVNYQQLVSEAEAIADRVRPYENRALLIEKLRSQLKFAATEREPEVLIAEASAAIQGAARESGVKVGSIRESVGRVSAKELASMQIECAGTVGSLVAFLHRFNTMDVPVIVDSIQLTTDPKKPGALRWVLAVVIANPAAWKKTEGDRNG